MSFCCMFKLKLKVILYKLKSSHKSSDWITSQVTSHRITEIVIGDFLKSKAHDLGAHLWSNQTQHQRHRKQSRAACKIEMVLPSEYEQYYSYCTIPILYVMVANGIPWKGNRENWPRRPRGSGIFWHTNRKGFNESGPSGRNWYPIAGSSCMTDDVRAY